MLYGPCLDSTPDERRVSETNHRTSTGQRQHDMKTLTDRQRETLEHIRAHLRRFGYPPSRKELSEKLGLSHPSSVEVHLQALQTKGWIELSPDTKRGIRLLDEASVDLPLVDLVTPRGEIAAASGNRGRRRRGARLAQDRTTEGRGRRRRRGEPTGAGRARPRQARGQGG